MVDFMIIESGTVAAIYNNCIGKNLFYIDKSKPLFTMSQAITLGI